MPYHNTYSFYELVLEVACLPLKFISVSSMGIYVQEERRKEAQERERSPRLTLEEELLLRSFPFKILLLYPEQLLFRCIFCLQFVPAEFIRFNSSFAFVYNRVVPSVEEYRIDFDRLDEMEAMDMEQLQPMTPAPPSMTDIDVEMEERPEEQPEELEQLAPVVEEPERLAPVEEAPLQPEQMELTDIPTTAEEIEEQVSRPPELEGQEEAVAQETGEEVVEVPDELVPALEAAAEQLPRVVSPAQLPLEVEDVPDVETLRSAVDAPTEQAPDLFAFERETARLGEDSPARYVFSVWNSFMFQRGIAGSAIEPGINCVAIIAL